MIAVLMVVQASPTWAGAINQQELLRRLPDQSRLEADYRDDAQRCVAMRELSDFIEHSSRPLSPGVGDKYRFYVDGCYQIDAKYSVMQRTSPAVEDYRQRITRWTNDRQFREAVLERYGLDRQALAITQASAPKDSLCSKIDGSTMAVLTVLDVVCIVAFAVICWVGNRQKFYRRNQAGIEEFRSFGHMVWTNLKWGILSIIGAICVLFFVPFTWFLLMYLHNC